MKYCFRDTQDIVKREGAENKANIEGFQRDGSYRRSVLEKFHLNLENEAQCQVFDCNRYAAMVVKLYSHTEQHGTVEISKTVKAIHKSVSTSDKIEQRKKQHEALECRMRNF